MAMSMDRLHGLLQVFVLSSVKHTRQTWHEWLMWRFGSPCGFGLPLSMMANEEHAA